MEKFVVDDGQKFDFGKTSEVSLGHGVTMPSDAPKLYENSNSYKSKLQYLITAYYFYSFSHLA